MFDWLTLRKLKAEEAHVRLAALLEIGAITSPKVFDFILGMLKDREFRVRSEAASALGRAQLPGAGDKLMLLVSGPESELRYLAARALKAMNWKPTASVDRASLAIGVHNFDAAIAEGSEAIAPLLLEVRTGWEPHIAEALDALIRLGAQAVPLVIDLFRGSKRDVAFAKTLVRLADKGGLLFINEILGGSDAEMRKTLCEVLRYERLEGAADALIQVVKDSSTDLSTRSAAVSALSQIGGAAVASALIAVFNGATEENFKGDIIKALGDMKSKAAVTMLIDAISNDKSVRVRSMAAYHLGLIGDTRAKGALLRALDDRERDIVASVAHGLGMLRIREAVDPLIELLPAFSERVYGDASRDAITGALGEIGDPRAMPTLIKILESDSYFVCRKSAATGLGNIGGLEAIAALEKTVRKGGTSYDGQDRVCQAAAEALAKLRDKATAV